MMTSLPQHWTSHTSPDGRPYYFNSVTQQSAWEKPDVLKTPLERALDATVWKEHSVPGSPDKKYYVNTETGVTEWEMPLEYKLIVDKFNSTTKDLPEVMPNFRIPTFASRTEALQKYAALLEEKSVQLDWTWEETLCKIVKSPIYRALSMIERKMGWDRHRQKLMDLETDYRKKRFDSDKEKLRRILSTREDITGSTKFKTLAQALSSDSTYRSTLEENREVICNEYVAELRVREKEIQRETRNEQLVKLKNLLANLSIDLSATWHEAKPKFEGHPLFSTLTHLNAVDTLTAFEDHMTDLEKQFKDNLERQKMLYKRQERKRRTAFKNLLDRLVKENKLKVYTKWKDILPELEEEKAFLHMVGQSGSTPLDLFRDVIIRFEEDVKDKLIAIERIVMQNHIKVLPKTTFEEFEQSVNSHGVFFDEDALRVAFDRLMAESLAIEKEEKRREERRLRRSMDDFKSVLKRASPPITLKTPWVEAAALVSHKPEYSDLAEEHRLPVFEKYISRLAEKAKDEGSEDGEEGMIISDDEKRRKSSKKEKKKHRRRRSESPSSEDEERKSKKKKHDDEPRRRDDDRDRSSSHRDRDPSRHTRDAHSRVRERTRDRDRSDRLSHRSSRDHPMEDRHVRDSHRTSGEYRYRRGSDDRAGSRHSEVPRDRKYGSVQVVEKTKKEYRSDHSFEDGELSS